MLRPSIKRWLAYGGIVVAAAASMATSAPTWEKEEGKRSLNDTLDTSTPEITRHFTVESSQNHTVRITARFTWDQNPSAQVRVRIQKDEDSPPQEAVVRATDAEDLGNGLRADTFMNLGQFQDCEGDKPCEQGYTVTMRIFDGAPQEMVDVHWSFLARIDGEGDDEPDGAFVEVTED